MVKSDWTNNEFLQPASISIYKTRDGHLKGSIGEMLAYKYLNRHCAVWSLAATGWPPWNILKDSRTLRLHYLKTRQFRYLKHCLWRGLYIWDMFAIRKPEIDTGKIETRYLVEVKTGLMRKGKRGWGSIHPKFPRLSEYSKMNAEAKSFGFTPIAVKVGMADDWTYHISCSNLDEYASDVAMAPSITIN